LKRRFGADIDYTMLAKLYRNPPEAQKRYSPAEWVSTRKTPIKGNLDWAPISTSYGEWLNLSMRTDMRRFTRLTNAFSKKSEPLPHGGTLHRVLQLNTRSRVAAGHAGDGGGHRRPALEHGEEIAALVYARAQKLGKRGSYQTWRALYASC
jgi:hypothetical protein